MLCLEITVEGYIKLSQPDSCQYVLLTVQEHSKLTNISNWFQFDIADVSMAFGAGLAIWVIGIKLGALARLIVGAKRG
ncbi:hypothetical protein [Aeromonas sobria]|uniref:hypothetical protein n=1 Tax=Aeromonas sobria TaxID=646 RepID=UPI003CFDD144